VNKPRPTYHEHYVTVSPGPPGNYHIECECGWTTALASLSDVRAAELALEHVRASQPRMTEEIFDRLGVG
jgi:hypothetical protein